MYDFTLTPEQQAFKKMCRDFATKEVAPIVAKADLVPDPKEAWDGVVAPVMKKALQQGLGKIGIPEEYGGGGAGMVETMILAEEFGAVDYGFAMSLWVTTTATRLLLNGTPAQKDKWWGPTIADETGSYIWATVSTEPPGGNEMMCPLPDPKYGIHTTAVRDGKGYRIKGQKLFITNGGEAVVRIVNARTRHDLPNAQGCNWFLFHKDTPGYSVGRYDSKIGGRLSTNTEIFFEDMWVPEEDMIGEEGKGFWVIERIYQENSLTLAATCIGVARTAYNLALEHARNRIIWGKPIIDYQGTSTRLVQMRLKIENCRALCEKLAWALDHPEQADGLDRLTKLAKYYSGQMVHEVTADAAYIFGGYGLMKGVPVEKLFRDGLITRVVEGCVEANEWMTAQYDLKPIV